MKPLVKELKRMNTLFGKPAYVPPQRPPRKLQDWIGKWIVDEWEDDENYTVVYSSLRKAVNASEDECFDEERMKPYKKCRNCQGTGNIADKLIKRGKRK